jgi:sensor histidine kinase YesM
LSFSVFFLVFVCVFVCFLDDTTDENWKIQYLDLMLQEADAIISILSPFLSSSSDSTSDTTSISSSSAVLNSFKALSLYSQAINNLLIPSSSLPSASSPYPNESYRLAAKSITQLLVPSVMATDRKNESNLPLVSMRFIVLLFSSLLFICFLSFLFFSFLFFSFILLISFSWFSFFSSSSSLLILILFLSRLCSLDSCLLYSCSYSD